MTDDAFLGRACCCVPRRIFVLIVAVLFCAYGLLDSIYFVLFKGILGDAPLTPSHACSGQRCMQLLRCDNTLRASYNWRKVCLDVGGLLFGFVGSLGAAYRNSGELRVFAYFLVFYAALLGVLVLYDWAYTFACDAYTFNVMNEALSWPVPNWPVRNAIKYEVVTNQKSYPVELVHQLTKLEVWWMYLFFEFVAALFCAYTARIAFELADGIRFGVIGMGATFDMLAWHERRMMEKEMKEELVQLLSREADARAATTEACQAIQAAIQTAARQASQAPPSAYGGLVH